MSDRTTSDPVLDPSMRTADVQSATQQYSTSGKEDIQASSTSAMGISGTQDDPSAQAQPLALPSGVPYPSVFGAGAAPNVAGATNGRQEGGQGVIDQNGTLPSESSTGMHGAVSTNGLPEQQAIPSREKQDQALLANTTGGPLAETTVRHEKQTQVEISRDGSHSVNMSGSEKPTRLSSSASSSDEDTNDEKKGRTRQGKKAKKGKKVKGDSGPKPVSLFALYRFHTPLEKTLNILSLILAIAAGATQPLMTLIFGKLTTSFTKFATYQGVLATQGNNPDPAVLAAFNAAKADLKSSAGKNASYLCYIGLGMLVCTYTYMLVWQWTGEVNAKKVRERYLQAVLRQDIAYFDELGAGEVATRIETDTHLVHTGIAEKVPTAVQYISTFITGFVLAYTQEWRLALAMSSILIPIMMAGATMQRFMIKHQSASLESIAKAGTIAEEVISSIRTAQAFGAQKPLAYLFDTHIARAVKVGSSGATVHGAGLSAMFFVIYSGYALAFFFGGRLINRNGIDSGKIITVFLSVLIGSFSMAMLAPELEAIGKARGGAAKLYQTIDRVPAIDTGSEEGERPDVVEGRITFENVKFSYPARPDVPILKGLTIEFPPGKTVALVGASGSGKSTVIALTERFYDPSEGIIRLDGRDLKSLNVRWLRQQIGLVSQEPTLFGVSIRQNIEHGLIGSRFENVSDAEKFELVKQAAMQANAHDFIMNLPAGYDTDVGERGFLISGGQKQRVAIARSIVSDPKILLLDEATSALDTQSEGIVQEALERASIGRTTIVIAHRLSTIKNADSIVVVGSGEIIEQGTHNQLLATPGSAYAQLVKAQELAAAKEKEQYSDQDEDLEWTEGDAANTNAHVITGDVSTNDSDDLKRERSRMSAKVKGELPAGLERRSTGRSIASEVLANRATEEGQGGEKEKLYSFFYLGRRCYRINREHKWFYVMGLIAAIGSGMVYPAIAILFGYSIRDFSGTDLQAVEDRARKNALWYFITAIVAAILIFLQQYFLIHTAETLTGKLRSMMFRGILRQDIAFFDEDKNSTGALTSKLADQPQKVQGLAGVTLGTIVQSISTIVTGMIIGLIYGPLLALIGIACIPLLVSAGYIRLRVVVLKDEKNKKAHSKSSHMASEAAGSIRTVASLTREEDCLRIYQKALEIPLYNSNRSAIRSNLLYAVTQALSFFVIALVFYVGATWIADGRYPTNAFFTVLNSVVFASIQAGNVFNFVPDASKAKSSATAILKQIDMRPEIDAESSEGKMVESSTIQGDLAFDHVHFRYPTRPGVRVLRDLSLKIPAGSFVALVGGSGCGKSTTIGLLERFYDVLAGSVTLDGTPISELNVASFRAQIALVGQEPTLYGGTIRFNILLGANKPADQVTEEELLQACRDANILEFIQSLPDGFETECGNKSASRFSGGQKQRIAIARALIRHPKILLLDEATSALDSTSERVVQAALDQAIRGDARRTTVAIAHRLSSIQNADIIYYFKDGKVAEAGTHQQLLEKRGGYFELTQMQKLSKM